MASFLVSSLQEIGLFQENRMMTAPLQVTVIVLFQLLLSSFTSACHSLLPVKHVVYTVWYIPRKSTSVNACWQYLAAAASQRWMVKISVLHSSSVLGANCFLLSVTYHREISQRDFTEITFAHCRTRDSTWDSMQPSSTKRRLPCSSANLALGMWGVGMGGLLPDWQSQWPCALQAGPGAPLGCQLRCPCVQPAAGRKGAGTKS